MPVMLYTRRGCHLCEAAEDILAAAGVDAELIDVDSEPDLVARYGLRVPVLEIDGEAAAEGRFDERQLTGVLARIRGRAGGRGGGAARGAGRRR